MFFLRPPKGGLSVGAVTLVAPVRPALTVGNATLAADNSPAFVLDEIAFTVYYPANPAPNARRKSLDWLLRPVSSSLRGFSRFAGLPGWLLWPIIRLFGAALKIPVYTNAPLLHPGETRKQWPLVIFSHGLCGTRTAYSQICSEMAASGRVVLAIEHRDGTAPACTSRAGSPDERTILYYRTADVVFPPDDREPRILPIRADQLVFRQHEIHRIYASFCAFVRDGTTLAAIDNSPVDLASWLPTGGPALVNCEDVTLIGHSFGGCTVLSVLSTPPPSPYPPIPISKVLLYDPWLEPLPLPGPSPTTSVSERTFADTDMELDAEKPGVHREEMLVINSEIFSLWKDHFTRLAGVVDAWEPQGRRLLTLVGSRHAHFSDFPQLPLVRTKVAAVQRDRVAKLTLAFLDGKLDVALEQVPTRKMEIKTVGTRKDGRPKRMIIGDVGDVVVH
ncbi:platelet-activating factor acetylhydrolase, isoform II-domain-containing protein [Mycena maculata]|uniref:1-alkyl-2-acetylglycerophosphocholine esterase n=1 Tax=Mycena maculata TaxID=230809 RepID=A0AAD7JK89_9AGAR|nr:platelet-activating factor acetylhydrolase, isoform II-domain-containing protein [Mycena maculata]